MIPKYIDEWLEIIEKMHNTTTYKLAWGRGILECISEGKYQKYDEEKSYIDVKDIAHNVLRYYWNQSYFFNLNQAGPAARNRSEVMDEVKKLIGIYQEIINSNCPEWFDISIEKIIKNKPKDYAQSISRISTNLLTNPCRYFINVDNKKNTVYTRDNKKIVFENNHIASLKEYSSVLSLILNYRWSQLLEDYNTAPKITQKVDRAAQNKIKRSNLKQYIKFLVLATNNEPIDFYTGERLSNNEISVDHVIPWSYMYSDDIWNLVLTTKSFNSSKSNILPSIDVIEKLNKRNEKLLNLIEEEKYKTSLKEAIEYHYVDKFYNSCRFDLKG